MQNGPYRTVHGLLCHMNRLSCNALVPKRSPFIDNNIFKLSDDLILKLKFCVAEHTVLSLYYPPLQW